MSRLASACFVGLLLMCSPAFALCSAYPYTFTNGTAADGGQVMANFTCAAKTSGATLDSVTLTGPTTVLGATTLTNTTLAGTTTLTGTTALPGAGAITPTGSVGILTATPNATLDVAGVINGRNYLIPATNGTAQWVKIGTFSAIQDGETIRIVAFIHNGFNAANSQDGVYEIIFKTSNGVNTDGNGFAGNGVYSETGYTTTIPSGYIKWKANAGGVFASAFDLFINLPSYTNGSHYQVTVGASASWTNVGALGQADPGAASSSVMIPAPQFTIPIGNVGIGTATPAYLLTVNGTAYATGAAGALSDFRHKKDIAAIRPGALDKVMQLRPVTFRWKDPRDDGMRGEQMGFIAQDVEKVLPSVVLTQKNAERTKGLKYNELLAVLTKAVQEQQSEIRVLKQSNASQAAAIAQLNAKVLRGRQARASVPKTEKAAGFARAAFEQYSTQILISGVGAH